jgi:integrase/recombinase XerD
MPKNNRAGQAAILSDSDFFKIKNALNNNRHKLICDIAWWTGERMGAILQLPVNAVYEPTGKPLNCITFFARTRKASPTGKRHTRQVPIHPSLKDSLTHFYRECNLGYEDLLFPGVDCINPLKFQSADDFLRTAIAKSGLQYKGISTHSFRRTFITKLASKGISTATIQKLTGHRDLKVLARYIEVSDRQLESAISVL